jgi:2-oxoglutarate dehydrogenase E2 component (dihydrolipoamide succinyltransferase)
LTKEDVSQHLKGSASSGDTKSTGDSKTSAKSLSVNGAGRVEERVPMTRLRRTIAQRLVEVQSTSAILTTFNEVDMKPVMDLRKKYKDQFEKSFNTKLGFMSFFLKASVEALKRFPAVNASIDGTDIVYHGFYDVGVAVSSPRGLVVPVLRNVDQMSLADIEREIAAFAVKAREGSLSIEDMQGGTFTVTNGGVFGSMLSTPIINAPQSAILGMHNIVERPVVVDGQIVIRPIMYVALSYDHRIIDGRESVSFLKTVKDLLEDPARLIVGV